MSKPLIDKLENMKRHLLTTRSYRIKVDLSISELNEIIRALEKNKGVEKED